MPNELAANLTSFLVYKGRLYELKLGDDVERISRCLFQGVRRIVGGARTPNFRLPTATSLGPVDRGIADLVIRMEFRFR